MPYFSPIGRCGLLLPLLLLLSRLPPAALLADFSPVSSRPASAANDSATTPYTLDPIPNSPNYRLNGKKDKGDRPWFNGRDQPQAHCVRPSPGHCEPLRNATCFGSRLPYSHTSFDLTDYFTHDKVRERLHEYQALRHIPRCWAVVQPFLCAVFMPKCENIGGSAKVFLPSFDMCRITLEPCRALLNASDLFPDYLRCDETLFPARCNNDVREMKFNTTGECLAPLVATDAASSYYPDIEGCGVQCADPLYTADEHRQVHNLVFVGASACLFCNLCTVCTFLIDWKNANKYPAVIIFYVNVCFAINCAAWLAQFVPGNREDIVCRKDGTPRHAEPSAGENLSCIAVFLAVYYSLVAAMVWFVLFTYSWQLRALGSVHRVDKKSSYFHLIAWSVPLVLTIATMALSEVDGNSIAGVCFVGYVNPAMRAAFLLGPLGGVLLLGGAFIARGMIVLVPLRRFMAEKSLSARKRIHGIIVRMALTAGVVCVCIAVVVWAQANEFRAKPLWAQSLRDFVVCKIARSHSDQHQHPAHGGGCRQVARPSLGVLQLQLLCLFVVGIVMSSWCWTRQSVGAWRRYVRKKFGEDGDDASAAGGGACGQRQKQKSKLIKETYELRKVFQDTGRLSLSFYEAHSDPAGLNFDINDMQSAATNEVNSTWYDYLPFLTQRRPAIIASTISLAKLNGGEGMQKYLGGGGGGGLSATRKSSVDSEINVSVRHYSLESRRNSMESQVSVQIAEVQTKVACRSTHHGRTGGHGHRNGGAGGPKSRHHHHHQMQHTASKRFHALHARRGSSTSMESSSHIITSRSSSKLTGLGRGGGGGDKRMRRRSANAGLPNVGDLNAFIGRFPGAEMACNFQGMTTTSDEDASLGGSRLRIEDARLDVQVVQQQQHRMNGGGGDDDRPCDDDDDDDDAATHEQSILLGMQQQHYQQQLRRIIGAADTFAIEDELQLQPLPPLHSKEGRNSKNSQKSGRSNGVASTAVSTSVRKSQRNSLQRKKQRKSAKQAKAAAGKRDHAHNNMVVALLEPRALQTTANTSDSSSTSASSTSSSSSSFTSYASEFALPLVAPPNGAQSSYSGVSVGKHSRSSKTSCDVGTQANAHEIATQTMTTTTTTGNEMALLKAVKVPMKRTVVDNAAEECHHIQAMGTQTAMVTTTTTTMGGGVSPPTPSSAATASMMLSMMGSMRRGTSGRRLGGVGGDAMSEAEKLRQLLLPSK